MLFWVNHPVSSERIMSIIQNTVMAHFHLNSYLFSAEWILPKQSKLIRTVTYSTPPKQQLQDPVACWLAVNMNIQSHSMSAHLGKPLSAIPSRAPHCTDSHAHITQIVVPHTAQIVMPHTTQIVTPHTAQTVRPQSAQIVVSHTARWSCPTQHDSHVLHTAR